MLVDLYSRVQDMEERKWEVATSPTVSPSTSCPARMRARCHPSPTQEPDLFNEVRQWVAKRMRQLPIITATTTDEDATSDEESPATWF